MALTRWSILALAAVLLACSGGGGSHPDCPDGPVIHYDPALLQEGNRVVFDASGDSDPASYRWSYRRAGDPAFRPIPAFDRSTRLAMVFAEPGDYAVRVADSVSACSTVELTVAERAIDLRSFTIDPEHFVGAFVFTRSGDAYDVALRLNDDVLGLIRTGFEFHYLYFDISLQDSSGSSLAGIASYQQSGAGVSASPQLQSLASTEAKDFPDVIEYAPLGVDVVKRLGFVDHLLAYLTDEVGGEKLPDAALQVEYFSSGRFFLAVPGDPPDEFAVVY